MRYCGKIGYAICEETEQSVWEDHIVEKSYFGDIVKLKSMWKGSDSRNEDLEIGHQISIVADAFANENFSSIKYAELMGTLWKVTGVEVERPRLILTLGGVYNGEQA